MDTIFAVRLIAETLARYRYRYSNEFVLHAGIDEVLTNASLTFQREFVAGPHDRFDFLVDGGIVIEAKVDGSLSQALSQVKRYAALPGVNGVLLVTTCLWGRGTELPPRLHGKPMRLVSLQRAAF